MTEESAVVPQSVTTGSRHVVSIQDIAFGGEGVGRLENFVVFVPFTIIGEEVEIEITESKKSFGRARLLRVLKPSPNRVAAPCPYFGDCGGCQYQHMAYEEQLRIKHKQVSDLFARVGGFENLRLDPVVPSPQEYHYRNRVMIRSQWVKFKQGLNIGFIRYDNRLVVDIDRCIISEPEVNEQISSVRKNPPPKGGIKVLVRKFPKDWVVPRDSFFQNNFFLLPALVELVRQAVLSSGSRFLVDLYCGVGFFGIELAGLVERFVGVELDRLEIHSARKNMEMRGITNGEFLDGPADELLPKVIERYSPGETTVLIDPPRTGCPPESLELLRRVQPKQILYISCHPATLARDLNILCADGVYTISRATPLDMFPQTQHVEVVADLRRAPAG
jgi:tRNA/tmRNA/rRNA uracil-C5-methylase (TrmA/RlmC/RlmD family)